MRPLTHGPAASQPVRVFLAIAFLAIVGLSRPQAGPPASAEIDALIRQLGSARFAQREAASRALHKLGEPAWNALYQEKSTSSDPEVRERAARLVGSIARREFVEVRRFEGHTDVIHSVAVSPDSRQLLSGGEDKTVRLWDVQNGKELRRLSDIDSVYCVAFSPDGGRALSSNKGFAVLWDLKTGKEMRRFNGGVTWMESVAFSPGGRRVYTVGRGATVVLWDAETGKERRQYAADTHMALRLAISPDGRYLLSASGFRPGNFEAPRLWDADSGKELRHFNGHGGPVRGLAFSPGSGQAVSCAMDGTVRLWDVDTGKEVRRFLGHAGAVRSVAFSADGRWILSAGDDRTVRMWDARTGEEVHRFEGHTGAISSVTCSPDGRFALSGGADRTLRLWRLPSPVSGR